MTFYEKMRVVCLVIPQGKVATYGQIALLCGKPRNSRQVGYGLKNDLAGRDIPAYRVVNSKGQLSGAEHFLLPGLQKILLEADGIPVTWDGHVWSVDLRTYGWKPSAAEVQAIQSRVPVDKLL